MNEYDLDLLVQGASPMSDAELARRDLSEALDELCEAIIDDVTVGVPVRSAVDASRRTPWRRVSRFPRRVAAFAAVGVLFLVVGLAISVSGDKDRSTTWAAPLVQLAERSPLLLLDDPGWRVTRADETSIEPNEGEMTFTKGGLAAELSWRRGPLSGWLDDRLHDGTDHGVVAVVNGEARVIRYNDTNAFTALWEADGRVLEFRIDDSDVTQFEQLLGLLKLVDVNTWLTAMPDTVIRRVDQPGAITRMLQGIPLPDGFDPATLSDAASIKDRYQLGARAVAAVSCAWVDTWASAKATGNDAAAQAAVDAMSTSGTWPVLQEMSKSGDFGRVLQRMVADMATANQQHASASDAVAARIRESFGCGQAPPPPTAAP